MSKKKRELQTEARGRNFAPLLIILGAALIVFAGGLVLYRSMSSQPAHQRANPSSSLVPPGATPPHARGSENARVVIEEFADFQCPPCAALHAELKPIKEEYGDRLRVVFRQLPLPVHGNAETAARASEAAAMQNRFWEMQDRMFTNQTQWAESENAREIFITYARELGMDAERFARDMNSPVVTQRLALDEQRANYLGVMSTPGVFINNRQMYAREINAAGGLRAVIASAMNENR